MLMFYRRPKLLEWWVTKYDVLRLLNGPDQAFDSNAFFLVFYCDVSSRTMEFHGKMHSIQTPGSDPLNTLAK